MFLTWLHTVNKTIYSDEYLLGMLSGYCGSHTLEVFITLVIVLVLLYTYSFKCFNSFPLGSREHYENHPCNKSCSKSFLCRCVVTTESDVCTMYITQ